MIIVYDPTTRRGMFTYDKPYPDGIIPMLDTQGYHYVIYEGPHLALHRVYIEQNGTVDELDDFSITVNKTTIENDGEDQYVISGLPTDTQVFVDNVLIGTFTGQFSMVSHEEGTYAIRLTHPHYLDHSTQVTVV